MQSITKKLNSKQKQIIEKVKDDLQQVEGDQPPVVKLVSYLQINIKIQSHAVKRWLNLDVKRFHQMVEQAVKEPPAPHFMRLTHLMKSDLPGPVDHLVLDLDRLETYLEQPVTELVDYLQGLITTWDRILSEKVSTYFQPINLNRLGPRAATYLEKKQICFFFELLALDETTIVEEDSYQVAETIERELMRQGISRDIQLGVKDEFYLRIMAAWVAETYQLLDIDR